MDELKSKLPQESVDLLPQLSAFWEAAADAKPELWKGHFLGAIFPPETAQLAYDKWRPKDGDVMVASFIKTGTSWTREMVRLIMYMNNPELERFTRSIPMLLTYIEAGPPCSFKIMDSLPHPRRILVSHLPTQVLNMEEYLKKDIKVIYVTRNPKDQAVSLFNFFNHVPYAKNPHFCDLVSTDWNVFFDNFIAGRVPTDVLEGEFYPYNILSWLPYRDHPKVHFVRYEDMRKNPASAVSEIANFIGSKLGQDDIAKIVERTTFKNMKEAVKSGQLADSQLMQAIKMYRKGEVGDWKNYFTVAQSEKMDEIISEKLKGTGITFEYE